MLRIAICDDEEKQLNQTAALLNTYLQSRPGLHGQVETFRSGGALLAREEEREGFDLYVLDILMPKLSGIDTGRRLRALGEGGEIIYLTSSNDFAADSYGVRAFFYLLKPVEEKKLFQVLDGGYLCHLYWGGRIDAASLPFLSREYAGPYVRDAREMEERPYPLNTLPQEFPCEGVTDFRVSAARITAGNGTSATDFRYRSHAVFNGKPPIDGLPATYADEDEAQTLAVTLYDNQTGVEAVLWYTAFKKLDAITRRVTVTNRGEAACTVNRLFSASLDFLQGSLELVQLYGGGADERHMERHPLSRAVTSVQSGRGISSHEHNPFIALCSPDATEYSGGVYGFNLVYSGSFAAVAEVDNQPSVRVLMGLNPE